MTICLGLTPHLTFLFSLLFFLVFPSFSLRDRKSTRLNSSHLVISYAVFCLKKKKTQRSYYIPTTNYRSRLSTYHRALHTICVPTPSYSSNSPAHSKTHTHIPLDLPTLHPDR